MTMFSATEIEAYLAGQELLLLDSKRRVAPSLSKEYRDALPKKGGTYAFFHSEKLFYVGETTSLRQRLSVHLRNPENHVLALKIARLLFEQPSSAADDGKVRRKFDEAHKELTRQWMSKKLLVAYVEMNIGRKELEERLLKKHKPTFNERSPVLP